MLPTYPQPTHKDQPHHQKRKAAKNAKPSVFSQDGLYGLITAPNPTSSTFKLHTMHSQTHVTALCSNKTTHSPLHPRKQIRPWLICAPGLLAN